MSPTLRQRFDRVAYRAQQLSILAPLTALQQGARLVIGARPPKLRRDQVEFLRQRYVDLLARDVQNVEAGLYPRELLFQIPVRHYLRLLPALLRDLPRVVERARARDYRDLADAVDTDRYPAYYRRNFHWQTDGYLSRHSAELYDVTVELLFRGTADVMRRQIIPPISRFVQEHAPIATTGRLRLLDVGCGTGRALKQLACAHPQLSYYGVDISPFYIQVARQVLRDIADVSLVAENAEQLPFVDGHFDIVSSVYLFHELPRKTRRQILSEIHRVLRPGGLLVIEDSAQLSESPEAAIFLRTFAREFHEPFYQDYLDDDLGALLDECGFEVAVTEPHLVAKVVTARKRLTAMPFG